MEGNRGWIMPESSTYDNNWSATAIPFYPFGCDRLLKLL